MTTTPVAPIILTRLKEIWEKYSIWRGLIVSVGGVVFMLCCLTILTLSSCMLGV